MLLVEVLPVRFCGLAEAFGGSAKETIVIAAVAATANHLTDLIVNLQI
jgi:hypothetical protein